MGWFAPSTPWRSGAWSLDLRDDEIADLAYDDRPVLRSIRAVVRDSNWDTAPLVVDRVDQTDATLTVHVRSEGLGSSFAGVVRVEASGAGVSVTCDLESAEAFDTNRTGLVVLHPQQLTGAALTVTHSDESTEATAFPLAISAHQPVFDIAGLAWEHDGLAVDVRFEGDVFEMEDQRNWTDASYKTYSRPLSLLFPYPVAAGERVVQTVSVHVEPTAQDASAAADADRIDLHPAGAFPSVGVGAATAPDPAPEFAPLGDTVLVELDLRTPTWSAALDRAATSGLPLDVRFVVDPDGHDALAAGAAALVGHHVVRASAFDTIGPARHVSPTAALTALRSGLSTAGLDLPVTGGSRSHFTELNRECHRLPADLDGFAVTVTPLFHALGTEQLIESLAMQRIVAQQTVSYADGLPVHIGPVCVRPRYNDVATAPQPAPTRTDLAEGYGAEFTGSVDPRQSAPELAAWTIASAAALAVPGVASLAYFEEWGPRGIRTATGEPLPVFAALEALTALTGELLTGDSPDGLVWALGSATADEATVLAANLDRVERTVTITTPAGEASVTLAPFTFTTTRFA